MDARLAAGSIQALADHARADLGARRLSEPPPGSRDFAPTSNRTAIILVNGFNGLGLHTLLGAVRLYGGGFRRMVFVQIGVLDAGNFKGADEIERLREHVKQEGERYVNFVQARGGAAEAVTAVGHEVLDELSKLVPDLTARFSNVVFFSGQLVFERETFLTRWLHNYTAFALQRRLFLRGLPCAIVPIRVLESVDSGVVPRGRARRFHRAPDTCVKGKSPAACPCHECRET